MKESGAAPCKRGYRGLISVPVVVALVLLSACSMTPSPLHSYIRSDREDKALAMIAKDATVNDRDRMGDTPLHVAAATGKQTIVRALVEHEADINARDFHGRTPLMLALREGQVDLARYFLSLGAGLETGYTLTNALFDAVTGGSIEMTEYMLQHGFSVDTVNRANTSALHIAASRGNKEMTALLLQHGADTAIRDDNGWTALHFAGARQDRETVRILLDAGAEPTKLATDGLSAFATGVVYEEAALKAAASSPPVAKDHYLTAAEHFAEAAAFYKSYAGMTQERIEAQILKNIFALAGGALAMAIQPGTPFPSASGGTVRLYTPVIVPQGGVDSLGAAKAAYLAAEQSALEGEKRCRDAAARLERDGG